MAIIFTLTALYTEQGLLGTDIAPRNDSAHNPPKPKHS